MEHSTRVSTRSSQKDLYQHLQDRLTASLTKLIMIVIEGPSRGSYKTFIQETPKSIPAELSYKHYRASSRSQCMHFLEDFRGNSTRSSHKDLYMITQGTLREDFRKISTRSSHKDFYKITQGHHTGFHQDLHKIFSQGLLTKIFIISAPRLQVISKIFMQGPHRGSRQDLHKIFFKRTSTRPWPRSLYKGLRECIVKLSQGCHRRTFQRTPKISLPGPLRISWKYGATQRDRSATPEVPDCASDLTMNTAPQRERSDTLKVRRGSRKHMLEFHQVLHAPRNMSIENLKTGCFSRFGIFEFYKVLPLTAVSQTETFEPFKTLSKFTCCTCYEHDLRNHCRPMCANI